MNESFDVDTPKWVMNGATLRVNSVSSQDYESKIEKKLLGLEFVSPRKAQMPMPGKRDQAQEPQMSKVEQSFFDDLEHPY